MSEKSAHKAVLQINIDVMEVLENNVLSGRPIKASELAEFGLKPKIVRTVNGFDKFDCLKKLTELINQMDTK